MAREVAAAVSSKFDFSTDTSDIIFTCVPRSKQGLIENGFDQAEIVGIKLAEYLGFPYVNLLKNKSEKVQKHLFSEQREKNAETAYYFIEKRKSLVKGKKIFLYDDVVTTGATMMNCVKILLEAGGSEVYCVSFASSVFSKK